MELPYRYILTSPHVELLQPLRKRLACAHALHPIQSSLLFILLPAKSRPLQSLCVCVLLAPVPPLPTHLLLQRIDLRTHSLSWSRPLPDSSASQGAALFPLGVIPSTCSSVSCCGCAYSAHLDFGPCYDFCASLCLCDGDRGCHSSASPSLSRDPVKSSCDIQT